MQSLYLIILAFIIVILLVPIPFVVKTTFSPYQNFGVLAFKFFNLKFKVSTFSVNGFGLVVTTKKGVEYQEIDITIEKRQIIYVQNLLNQLKDKIKIKQMYYISRIGTGNALKTAMTIGTLNQLFYSLFSFLKNEKQTASLTVNSIPEWKNKVFNMAMGFKFSISIYDILFCLIYANLKARRVTK